MTRGLVLGLLALLLAGPAWADTSPDCGMLTHLACADANDVISAEWTFTDPTPFHFEGLTDDGFETTVSVTDPTQDRTLTIPDADTATAQAVSCTGGEHVSAFSATTGAFTCTADSGGGGHALLSATHTDTVASTVTRGDLIVGTAGGWDDLAVGGAATFLRSDGTDPSWAAISSADIGAGDLANALVWNTSCTASPCTLPSTPRTADTALIVHHTLTLRRVTACGGVNEYTLSGTTVTFCGTAPSTGADAAFVTYEL